LHRYCNKILVIKFISTFDLNCVVSNNSIALPVQPWLTGLRDRSDFDRPLRRYCRSSVVSGLVIKRDQVDFVIIFDRVIVAGFLSGNFGRAIALANFCLNRLFSDCVYRDVVGNESA
jgi:hypothetical protein